jgi:DedD protein
LIGTRAGVLRSVVPFDNSGHTERLAQGMGLFSSRMGQEPAAAERAAGAAATDPVQAARAQARRRLIGAAVLLGIGVLAFPLLFETQPRPIPVDIPIDIPRKENAPPLPLPAPRAASGVVTTPRISSGVITERPVAEPKRDAAAAPAAAPRTSETKPPPAPKTETAAAPKAAAAPAKPKAPAAAATADDEAARAKALLEGRSVEPRDKAAETVAAVAPHRSATGAATDDKADAATGGRFVVQVAAYSDAGAARDMRQRIEKLGLKSYTQVVEVDGARRIRVRVGPFIGRDDADKAAATLKGAGLPAAVLAL